MAIQEIVCGLFKFGKVCNTIPIDKFLIEYLLVPSVITILMVYMIVDHLMEDVKLQIKALLSITAYIVFIYSGLFSIFAPLMYAYMYFAILILGGIFLFTRLIPGGGMTELTKSARTYRESKTDAKQIERAAETRSKELRHFQEMILDMEKKGVIMDFETKNIINMLMHQMGAEVDILNSLAGQYKEVSNHLALAGSDEERKRLAGDQKMTKNDFRSHESEYNRLANETKYKLHQEQQHKRGTERRI